MSTALPELALFRAGQKLRSIEASDLTHIQSIEHLNPHNTGKTGILLLHGYSATPYSMHELANILIQEQYSVIAPMISGHGTTVADFENSTWQTWQDSAIKAYHTLKNHCDHVYVVGLSMGGALALNIAAREPDIEHLFLLGPAVYPPWHLVALQYIQTPCHWLGFKSLPCKGGSFLNPHAHDYQYPTIPVSTLNNLYLLMQHTQTQLVQVTAPTTLFWGQHDKVVPIKNGQYLLDQLSSTSTNLISLQHSAHVLPLDMDRKKIYHTVLTLISRMAQAT